MAGIKLTIDLPTLVADRLASFTGEDITDLEKEMKLDTDLGLKGAGLGELAASLRKVVRMFKGAGNFNVSDIDTTGTVQDLIDLVEERIGA